MIVIDRYDGRESRFSGLIRPPGRIFAGRFPVAVNGERFAGFRPERLRPFSAHLYRYRPNIRVEIIGVIRQDFFDGVIQT